MNEENKPYNIEYTFHIQSAEDFFRQLNEHADEILKSYEANEDLTLAQDMLRGIGVNV
jgi:hypothetical protein